MGEGTFIQTALGFWAFVTGIFLCAVYDIFRVLRLRRRVNGLMLFVADFAFCLVSAVAMLVLFFNLSFGKVRIYAFVFALLGFLLWRFTVGRAFVALVGRVIDFLHSIVSAIKTYLKKLYHRTERFLTTLRQ